MEKYRQKQGVWLQSYKLKVVGSFDPIIDIHGSDPSEFGNGYRFPLLLSHQGSHLRCVILVFCTKTATDGKKNQKEGNVLLEQHFY